jgi:hypothetical protein
MWWPRWRELGAAASRSAYVSTAAAIFRAFGTLGEDQIIPSFRKLVNFPSRHVLYYFISFPVMCGPSLLVACCFLSSRHALKASALYIPTYKVPFSRGIFIN